MNGALVSRLRRSPFAIAAGVLAALAIIFVSELAHWTSTGAMNRFSEVTQARLRVQRVLRLIVDAETAQRGYLLTGRPDYLEPYRNAIEALPESLTWLRQHYATQPENTPAMVELEETVANKLSELSNTIGLYDEGRHDAWREILLSNIGKERMDSIRSSAEQMLVRESNLFRQTRQGVFDSMLFTRVGVAVMTVLALLGWVTYLRQARALEDQRRREQLALKAERDLLEAEVQMRTEELTGLSRHLLSAREDERSRIARELHDELGAMLTAAKLDVARVKARIVPMAPEVAERISHLNETLNNGIALKRRIIEDLHPSSLTNFGLVAALEIQLREFEARSEATVGASLQPVALSPTCELTVYRLVQEALTNISKYSKAKTVHVELAATDDAVQITVADDGVGFDPAQQKGSAHGLIGMRYRVEAEGGTLTLHSAPGRGTRIGATLPLAAPA